MFVFGKPHMKHSGIWMQHSPMEKSNHSEDTALQTISQATAGRHEAGLKGGWGEWHLRSPAGWPFLERWRATANKWRASATKVMFSYLKDITEQDLKLVIDREGERHCHFSQLLLSLLLCRTPDKYCFFFFLLHNELWDKQIVVATNSVSILFYTCYFFDLDL